MQLDHIEAGVGKLRSLLELALAYALATELRAAAVPALQYPATAKPGKRLPFASRVGFPFVRVVARQEVETAVLRLKTRGERREVQVPRTQLSTCLAARLPDVSPPAPPTAPTQGGLPWRLTSV